MLTRSGAASRLGPDRLYPAVVAEREGWSDGRVALAAAGEVAAVGMLGTVRDGVSRCSYDPLREDDGRTVSRLGRLDREPPPVRLADDVCSGSADS